MQLYTIKGQGDVNKAVAELNTELFEEITVVEKKAMPLGCTSPEPPVNDTWTAQGWANNYALEMIEANCAWAITKGSSNVVVGIADTDFELTHEDLKNQIISIDGQSTASALHGTMVAGLVCAQTNNNKGIASIGYNTKVAAHRIPCDAYGLTDPTDIEEALWNLYQDGVDIINLSWTMSGLDYDGAAEIIDNGTVLILGAGNYPTNECHNHIADIPGVIIVSSVDSNSEHDPTGDAHNEWVDICAPGQNVTSTTIGNTYGPGSGTSYATPLVSGTAALMLAANQYLTPADVELIIEQTAGVIRDAALFPGLLGAGKLNAYQAVRCADYYNSLESLTGKFSGTKTAYKVAINNAVMTGNSTIYARRFYISGTFKAPVGKNLSIQPLALDCN